ncbi:hypothetical protein J6590_058099 [Homalodisca vitripennis]|nr:hypothetical protein J6590_058099 [Homalodisca vitripennis]
MNTSGCKLTLPLLIRLPVTASCSAFRPYSTLAFTSNGVVDECLGMQAHSASTNPSSSVFRLPVTASCSAFRPYSTLAFTSNGAVDKYLGMQAHSASTNPSSGDGFLLRIPSLLHSCIHLKRLPVTASCSAFCPYSTLAFTSNGAVDEYLGMQAHSASTNPSSSVFRLPVTASCSAFRPYSTLAFTSNGAVDKYLGMQAHSASTNPSSGDGFLLRIPSLLHSCIHLKRCSE